VDNITLISQTILKYLVPNPRYLPVSIPGQLTIQGLLASASRTTLQRIRRKIDLWTEKGVEGSNS